MNHSGWSEATSRLFIDYARYFVPEREYQMRIIKERLSHLGSPYRILDLCCGDGFLSETLLESLPGLHIYGLDGSNEMVRMAEKPFSFR